MSDFITFFVLPLDLRIKNQFLGFLINKLSICHCTSFEIYWAMFLTPIHRPICNLVRCSFYCSLFTLAGRGRGLHDIKCNYHWKIPHVCSFIFMSHIKQVKGSSIKTFHNNISEREKIGPFLSETDCMLYLFYISFYLCFKTVINNKINDNSL